MTSSQSWNGFVTRRQLQIALSLCMHGASLVAQTVKNPPAMQDTWVQSPDWEDPQEKGMATHSSVLACRIPWPEDLAGCRPWGHKESEVTEGAVLSHSLYVCILLLVSACMLVGRHCFRGGVLSEATLSPPFSTSLVPSWALPHLHQHPPTISARETTPEQVLLDPAGNQ